MKFNLARFKETEKLLRNETGFAGRFYPMDDDNVVIPFVLACPEDIYDPSSPQENREPSQDICDRIDRAIQFVPILRNIRLRFTVPKISEDQKREATNILRNRFALDVKRQQAADRYTKFKALFLLLSGTIVLLFSYMLDNWTSLNHVFYDTVNICGTFMIWEAADTFFLQRRAQRYDMANLLRLYTSEIIFEEI
jgi:hypothetical protein